MKKGFQVTLDDIARKLKVSKVTVSKALRGHPDISTERVKKIQALAQELGYLPNYMARNLSSKHTHMIGVVVPKIAHYFFSSVIESMYDTAFHQNYEIILTVSQENSERELRHLQTLLSMRVDGIIISVTQQTKDYAIFKRVKDMGIPLTFMDRIIDMKGFNAVIADDYGGAFAATEQAIHVGYSKIAHLAGFSHTYIGRERYRGFEMAMKKHEIAIKPEWVVRGGFSEIDGYNGFMQLFKSEDRPEFIFASTFPVALGIYHAAEEMGVKIPDDVDIISFGSSGLNQFLSPPMSYIEQPTIELGVKAVELTLHSIQQKDEFVPQTIKLPTRLVLCKTCVQGITN
ncbi:MAG: LacI family DNA-binding transcriptional regulator [Bacteroidota bacterium]|jgi:LacI family transcriptional regulator